VLRLIRFHARSGARVALRVNGLIAATVVFLFGLELDALDHVHRVMLQLVTVDPRDGARWLFAALAVASAAIAAPRVALGSTGWMGSLPVPAATMRRAAVVAVSSTQIFLIVVTIASIAATAILYGATLSSAKLVGIPLILLASGLVVLPLERKAGGAAAWIALGLAIPGRWTSDIASVLALALADRFAGGISRTRSSGRRRTSRWTALASPVAHWVRLTMRTVPAARIFSDGILTVVFVGFGYLVVLNNPDLNATDSARAIRICGMLGLMSAAAAFATTVVRRRQPWPWLRSLPWSSRQRVVGDCLVMAAPLGITALSLLPLDWRSAVALALLVPPMATAAAVGIRRGSRRQTSAALEPVALGLAAGTLVALWPWTAMLGLVAAPWLFRWATRLDLASVVTRWDELNHDAPGDSAWARP